MLKYGKNSNKRFGCLLNFKFFILALNGCGRLLNFSKIKDFDYFLQAALWSKQVFKKYYRKFLNKTK